MIQANILLSFIIIICVLVVPPFIKWYVKRSRLIKIIDAVPGPKSYPVIGTAYLFMGVERKHLFRYMRSIKSKFPYITRAWLGPFPQIELKKAEYIEQILSSSTEHLQKAWTYKFVRRWLREGLLTSDGAKWHARRKIITPTFHFSILESFCDIFAENSICLVEKLQPYANSGHAIDICPFVAHAALDIIGEAAMGIKINSQHETNVEYVGAVSKAAELIIHCMLRPWLHSDLVYPLTSYGREMKKCLKILFNFTESVIQDRKLLRREEGTNEQWTEQEGGIYGKKKQLAFLDLLLEHNKKSNLEAQLTDEDIRQEVDTFMFEGHDTTTSAITWSLFLLGLHPDIQEDLYKEMDEIFHGSMRAPTIKDFSEMKLLERVIKESLRLYPAVPLMGRTLSEDVQLDKYLLPAGCTIMIEVFSLHRDERWFPDAERFDPDRFLPENTVNRHPYAYIPFSAGARNCIGQKFAMYEEKSILSSIIRNYRFRTQGTREDISQLLEMVLRSYNGIWLTLEKRCI